MDIFWEGGEDLKENRQAGRNNPSDGGGKGREEFNKENKAKYKREQLWNGVNETKY